MKLRQSDSWIVRAVAEPPFGKLRAGRIPKQLADLRLVDTVEMLPRSLHSMAGAPRTARTKQPAISVGMTELRKEKPRGRSELRPYKEMGTQAEACATGGLGHLKVAATR